MTHELSRYLFLAGATPVVVLGAAHACLTPRRPGLPTGLSPADPHLAELMSQTRLRLTPRTDMWRAWVGFNYSHGLGLMVLGGLVLLSGSSELLFATGAAILVPFAFFASAIYLLLAIKYWFRAPILGCGLSFLLFLCSWILLPGGGVGR